MKSDTYLSTPKGVWKTFVLPTATCCLLSLSSICPPAHAASAELPEAPSALVSESADSSDDFRPGISEMEPFTLEEAIEDHFLISMCPPDEKEEIASYIDVGEDSVKKVPYPAARNKVRDKAVVPATGGELAAPELHRTMEAAACEKEDQQEKQVEREQQQLAEYLASEAGIREQLIQAALSRQGVPYAYGGTDPDYGMDCSGFTQWCYSQVGIPIGRTSYAQEGGAVEIVGVEDARPGDILCAGGHVAIYLGGGEMIHEPQSGDVCRISSDLSQFYCAARYI